MLARALKAWMKKTEMQQQQDTSPQIELFLEYMGSASGRVWSMKRRAELVVWLK